MQERHDILTRTIGYLDEEQEAMDTGFMLLICSTITMVVGSLLQIFFFYLYNGPFHPFANILVDETEGKESIFSFSNHCNLDLSSSISFQKLPILNKLILQRTTMMKSLNCLQLVTNQHKPRMFKALSRNLWKKTTTRNKKMHCHYHPRMKQKFDCLSIKLFIYLYGN